VGIIIAAFFGVALSLRIYPVYDQVFVGGWIKFTGVDAYYHMRLVDNLLRHFPQYMTFDPYTFYPHGASVGWPPFFDWLIAGIAWLAGLGSPTQHTVNVVGVYLPAFLGAIAVVPVYFIGKALFNRWAGVISAGVIALLPSEFLGRTILGFTDHHVAEVLFTTITMLFLILAIKTAKQRQLTFNHLRDRDWSTIIRPLVYSLLAGISLGIYILSWVGALLFVFLLFVYFLIQFVVDHLKGEKTGYLGVTGTVLFLIASIISLPIMPWTWFSRLYVPSLTIALVTPVILASLSWLMARAKLKPAYYPLAIIGLGLAGLGIFHIVDPSLIGSMLARFGIFTRSGAALTISEVKPLLFPEGDFTFNVAWGNFTTGFFISIISLVILIIYLVIKRGEADKTLFVVWGLVMLLATLGQRRFGYYFSVNVALLSGYLSWLILEFAGFKEAATKSQIPDKMKWLKVKAKKRWKGRFRPTIQYVIMTLAVVAIFFLNIFPNISPAIATAKASAHFAPDDGWCESLYWMKENTPEPFGNSGFYFELYQPPPNNQDYKYPESAYGVVSWWDYGHWITRIAHRIPICNPFQRGVTEAALFFTAQNEDSASKIIDSLDSKYIVIDYATATSKFYAMPTWIGIEKEEFYDAYYQVEGSKLVPILLFHPEYYRSLAIRLYNFDGNEVIPESSAVISYQEKVSREGVRYKEIISLKSFPSYESAEAYISRQESGSHKIVGLSPFVTPVPLGELEHYKLIYSSDDLVKQPQLGMISKVKIFEYVK
jgi:oligosaccharyl transferase (archaeosortase A-associated)